MLRRASGSDSDRKKLKRTKEALMKDLRLIFSEIGALQNWLDAPNDQLGGKKPNELLGTPEQQQLVEIVERQLARQQEIENLRRKYAEDFDRIKGIMPSLEELRSLSVEPPQELLDGEW